MHRCLEEATLLADDLISSQFIYAAQNKKDKLIGIKRRTYSGCAKTVELQEAFNEAFHRKLVSLSGAELHGQLLTIAKDEPGLGASSFRELGESILRVALGEQAGKVRPAGGQQGVGSDSENGMDLIRLLPEYQHILSWSWNSLRYSASILSRWAVLHANDAEPPVRNLCTQIGYQLVHILLHCRHRGTVEAVCVSLQHYLSTAQRLQETNNSISLVSCEQVLDLCWTVLCHYGYSVTRRAAGLWPAVKAALLAEQARKDQRVHLHTLEERRFFLQTYPLIFLLAIYDTDANIVWYVSLTMASSSTGQLGYHGIFPLQLPLRRQPPKAEQFEASDVVDDTGPSALVLRLTGTNSGRAPPTSIEIFGKYPTLLELCLRELEMAAKLQISRPNRTTQVIPILTLFGRLSPGEWTDSFHWDNALTYLDSLMTTRSPGAFILAHHLCNLMSLAVDPDNSACVRGRFLSWLSTNSVRLLSPTIIPFHLEAILTLHLLAHRICGEFPHLDVTLSPDVTPTVLHRLLCIAEDSDIRGWVPSLLNYWTQRTELHRTHPMLCWRIVEVWSSVLSAHSTTESSALASALTNLSLLPILKELLDGGCDSIHQSMALLCAVACFCDQSNSSFIKTLFFALFDACNEVRTKIGCFIHQRLCDIPTKYLQQPVCHLISVLRLLDNMLPSWLPFPESQLVFLYDIWWDVMDDLLERISEEISMRKRQALYEREVDNDFCEPRLLFQLLFERLLRTDYKVLKRHKQVLDEVIARAHGRISVLEPLCSMSSASTSPSVHAWNIGMSFLADLRANLSVDSPDILM
ncbi:hypothetical protein CLF_108148 [Clonorchis sinensis]|uniref:DUF2428 domain-containing protein n=1 Tax=Clonorchis sinensis TaxID=79923 RepID=G7YHP8_CLOSI|nr:hypothetical protein CLF_108148 [Clonorchis sinensis]